MKNKILEFINKIDKNIFIIFLFTIFIFLPFVSKYWAFGHDNTYHIINVIALSKKWNFFNTLSLKVLPYIANNLGYGSAIFYPQLPHFIAAFFFKIFNIFHMNVVYGIKVSQFLEVFISGIIMYKLVLKITKNKNSGLVASIFYISSAYHLSDIFIRTAFNETFIFIFLPIVFLGIVYLLENNYKKFYIYFVIGYYGLINSHLVVSVYITFFIILILLINYKKFLKLQYISKFLIASIIVLLLSLPFLVPMIEHKLLGNYEIFNGNALADDPKLTINSLNLFDLFDFNAKSTGINFTLNIISILLFGVTCYKYKNIKNEKNAWLLKGLIISFFLAIICTNKMFPWIKLPDTLKLIQFPWRLLTIIVFALSVVSSFALLSLKKQEEKTIVLVCIISSLLYANFLLSSIDYKEVHSENFDYLTKYGIGGGEYYPIKAFDNMEYILSKENKVQIKNGKAIIKSVENDTPNLKFEIKNIDEPVTLELPRIYYLGFRVEQYSEKGNTKILNYYENEDGLMEIKVKEPSTITVTYPGTILGQISNIISYITLIICLLYLIKIRKNRVK